MVDGNPPTGYRRTLVSELTPHLVQRALAQDPVAIRELVRAIQPVIQARVARAFFRYRRAAKGRDVRQEVDDLVQQCFVALFADGGRVLLQWDPSRGLGLLGYVGLVVEREVLSLLRSRRQNPWTEDPTLSEDFDARPDGGLGPEQLLESRQLLRAVVERLRAQLSDKGLALFEILVVDARSVEDVCAVMSMTPDAVYAWRSRLARLARTIAAELMSDTSSNPRTAKAD